MSCDCAPDGRYVRVAATEGILAYWCAEPDVSGGLEVAMLHAAEWWAAWKARSRAPR